MATSTVLVIGSGVLVARVFVGVCVRLGEPLITSNVAVAFWSFASKILVARASAVRTSAARLVSVLIFNAVATMGTNVGVDDGVSVRDGLRVLLGVTLGPYVAVAVRDGVNDRVGLWFGFGVMVRVFVRDAVRVCVTV